MERAVVLIVLLAVCHWGAAFSLGASAPHPRFRRQSLSTDAMKLASDHTDSAGLDRPVGEVHGLVRPHGGGFLPNDFNIGATAGVGSVVYRSPDKQHSIGVGATVDHTRGRYDGSSFKTPLNPAVGVGYTFRF